MTDYMEPMESGISYGQNTEIYLKRVLTGDAESVRLRLAAALERVGYDIVEDEPHMQGRLGRCVGLFDDTHRQTQTIERALDARHIRLRHQAPVAIARREGRACARSGNNRRAGEQSQR